MDFLSPLCRWAIEQTDADLPSALLHDIHHQHAVLRFRLEEANSDKKDALAQARELNRFSEPVSSPWGSVAVCAHIFALRYPQLTWNSYLSSIAIAEECSARIGAYLWFQPEGTRALWMRVVAVSTVYARAHRITASELRQLLVLAFDQIRTVPTSAYQTAPHALDSLAWLLCDQAILRLQNNEQGSPYVEWPNLPLLHHAFLGLGSIYFSTVRIFNNSAGTLSNRVAFEAINEILIRHVKAADKPLRPDQLLRIEVETGFKEFNQRLDLRPESINANLGYLVGARLLSREISSDWQDPRWVKSNEVSIREIAQRVVCQGSNELRMAQWHDRITAFGPLFANVDGEQLCQAIGVQGWFHRQRFSRLLKEHRYRPFDDLNFDLDGWVPQNPTKVNLFTTRGGKWPESRADISGVAARWTAIVQNIRGNLPDVVPTTSLGDVI